VRAPYVPVRGTMTAAEFIHVARKPNYDFEKRRKEQERAAKKNAKREERLRRKQEGLPEEDEGEGTTVEPGGEPGDESGAPPQA
jgi:hypothetical protein